MDAINLSAMQKVQETTFQALLNSKAAGSALYDYVSAYAKVSALGREDIANAVTAYSAYTKNADQLERMIKLTERLYAKDPTQGAEGAVFAMRELLSGDTMSIKDRFNMSGFSGETIRNFANTGDIEGMLDYVDQMFNRFGATQEVVDANFDNLTTQTNIFTSNLKTAIAESATPAMETLAGTMRRLNAEMDAGKYQPDEHPFTGLARMIHGIGAVKQAVPEMTVWASAPTYLRQFSDLYTAGAVEAGLCDGMLFGRMAFADPDFANEIIKQGRIDPKHICLTCGMCGDLIRAHKPTGCVVRDAETFRPFYKEFLEIKKTQPANFRG